LYSPNRKPRDAQAQELKIYIYCLLELRVEDGKDVPQVEHEIGTLAHEVALTEAVKAVIFYSYDYDSFLGTYFKTRRTSG